ncbi:double-CXXCG motif protein [Pyxidicoccus sp. MSG2]|uniref:SitI6 family double-CXXCG motif immunity protein n=1 Tax=Pyxidicoccus sp. MSG2 TaxID=2996790 RepID=UPI002271A2F7|nr:double-CXXCG motif protein [Pyxidicoccus sp. MSG2]MCY1019442.1 double-CXXCG motif protein [Pyxidicoccus sp. MSG2]
MSRYFLLDEDQAAAAKHGGVVNAWHKLGLPGVRCHTCGATWTDAGHEYPCVDLSQLPERGDFEKARPEPFPEFARLRELVRPLAPRNAELPPGTGFGPLVGRAHGEFGPIAWVGGLKLLVHRAVLERIQAAGVRGLLGCRTELRFRQKNPPELLELQIEPHGRLHPDCIPPDVPPPCATCGRHAFKWPDSPILDAASLPTDLDLFRVGNFATMIVGTERFMNAVQHLELDGLTFRELHTR